MTEQNRKISGDKIDVNTIVMTNCESESFSEEKLLKHQKRYFVYNCYSSVESECCFDAGTCVQSAKFLDPKKRNDPLESTLFDVLFSKAKKNCVIQMKNDGILKSL